MEQIKYYINEEKGVVIAKIVDVFEIIRQENNLLINKWKKNILNGETMLEEPVNVFDRWRQITTKPDIIIGKAKCNLEDKDVFNLDFGKQLATMRVIEKLSIIKKDFYDFAINSHKQLIDNYYDVKLYYNVERKLRQQENIKNLISPQI